MATNQDIDSMARSLGFEFSQNPLDFARPAGDIADRKLKELQLFLATKKAADAKTAQDQLLSGAALAGTNATPSELAAFKPGLPSVLDASFPAGSVPSAPPDTGNPPVITPSATPAAQRLDVLDAAAAKNAPDVEAVRRSQALNDAGLNEAQIAQARVSAQHERLYGAAADVAVARRDTLNNLLNDPNLDPMLKNEIAQNKISFKSQRVKVQHKDGTVGYYDATPNLSGGYDYAQATDENGNPLAAPAGASDHATSLQKNAAFVARVLYANDPDAEGKAVTMLTNLKTKSPADAWASLVREVSKMNYGRYSRDPQMMHDKTAELWRVSRPGEPLPAEAPPAPAAPQLGQAAPAPATSPVPETLPPPVAGRLKEGTITTFGNGQQWTLRNGRPSRVR